MLAVRDEKRRQKQTRCLHIRCLLLDKNGRPIYLNSEDARTQLHQLNPTLDTCLKQFSIVPASGNCEPSDPFSRWLRFHFAFQRERRLHVLLSYPSRRCFYDVIKALAKTPGVGVEETNGEFGSGVELNWTELLYFHPGAQISRSF